MGLFTDFVAKTNPDNRHEYLNCDQTDEIIIGGTCEHIFNIGFNYRTLIKSAKVFYTQGLDKVLEIAITDSMVSTDGTIIIVTLTPAQTQLFIRTTLDTKCQLKFITNEDKILFDEPHKLKVLEPIVVEELVTGGNE